jgi:hypothetical protein
MPFTTEDQIRERVAVLKVLGATLRDRIPDKRTSDFLVGRHLVVLEDVERFLLPQAAKSSNSRMWIESAAFVVKQTEDALKYADEAVKNYGTAIQLIF